MLYAALSIGNFEEGETRSLIDELISTIATGGTKQRLRMLERITNLSAAGSRCFRAL